MNYGKKGVSHKQAELTSKSAMLGKKVAVTIFKLVMISAISIGVILLFAGVGMFRGIIESAPDIENLEAAVVPTAFSTTVYDQSGAETTKLVAADSNRAYAKIDTIPLNLQHAFVAIEDERFYEHNGIDIKGIIRAGVVGIKSGSFSEGASTITQQLLKNSIFKSWTEEKSLADKFRRKFQEQYLALKLEKTMSKELILENYMNTINLGQNTLGVQAAAKRYFNKDVSELNLSECAVIAAITQNPTRYNPITNPDKNSERREKVLLNMKTQEYITEQEYEEALADDVYARIQNVNSETVTTSIYSYFVDELTEQVIADLQEQKGFTYTQAYNALYSGGLSIYTTQDAGMQRIVDEEFADPENYPEGTKVALTYELSVELADGTVENHSTQMFEAHFKESKGVGFDMVFADEEEAKEYIQLYKDEVLQSGQTVIAETISITPQPQASFTLMDQHTGYVKALVGGRGTKEASLTLNRATNTKRQPGSTFKVVSTYAPALDTGQFTLASVQDDAPFNYEDSGDGVGRPVSNWYTSGYKGLCTLRYGIEQSLNIVAVKTLTAITPQVGYDYLQDFGFTTLVDKRTTEEGKVYTDIHQSLALGGITDGVYNIELNAAYAAIANDGVYIKPIYYTKILDHDGNVLLEAVPQTTTVLKETTAFLLTDAMKDVVSQGTGTLAQIDGQVVAGKTGTTSSNKDVWFAGFTPYYTATIWAGYDNNRSLNSKNGETTFHKKMWQKIMSRVHEGLETKDFTVPDGIETAEVCKKSGKLAVAGLCDCDQRGSMVITEYFAEGTVPTEVCNTHVKALICVESGSLAGDFCPWVQERVVVIRPALQPGVADVATEDSPYALSQDQLLNGCPLHGGTPFTPYSVTTTAPAAATDPNAAATDAAGTNIGEILNGVGQ